MHMAGMNFQTRSNMS
ncbi:MAG: hypothetical protein E7B11_06825 [Clostridiales bacterium]|nr:hypothetical protein [Clostridiales bacterium]